MRLAAWLTAVTMCLVGSVAQAAGAPAHYGVDLTLSPDQDSVRARVAIDLPPGQAHGEQVFFLGDRFHIRSAEADSGVKVTVTPTDKPFPHLQQVAVSFAPSRAAAGRIRHRL